MTTPFIVRSTMTKAEFVAWLRKRTDLWSTRAEFNAWLKRRTSMWKMLCKRW